MSGTAYRTPAEIAEDMPKAPTPINWQPLRRALAWLIVIAGSDVLLSGLFTVCNGPPWHWALFFGSLKVCLVIFAIGWAIRWAVLELSKS